jgi:hypothetical protein
VSFEIKQVNLLEEEDVMRETLLVVAFVLCAGVIGCNREEHDRAERLLVMFDPADVVVPAGQVVSVYAVIDGGTEPFIFQWEWSGPYDYGYGDGPLFRVTPPPQTVGSTQYVIHVWVTDSRGQVAEAEKLVTVGAQPPVVTTPVANSQTVATPYQTPISITLTGSSANGTSLVYSLLSITSHGTVAGTAPFNPGNAPQFLVYTPFAGFSGQDSFTFRVNDGLRDSNTATVTIVVGSPTGQPTTVFLSPNPTSGHVPLTVVFAANTSFDIGVSITRYQWDFTGDGNFDQDTGTVPTASYTYLYTGSYSPRVRVTDSRGQTAEAQDLVIVGTQPPVVTTPVADNQAVAVSYQTARSIILTGSTTNGGNLVYSVLTSPAYGTLSGMAPVLVYTPNSGFSGQDSFTFRVNDGLRDSNTATVTLVVGSPTGQPTTVFLSPNPTSGHVPLTVVFAANTSFDIGVSITRYQWDFTGDGNFDQDTGTVPTASYTYLYTGSYSPRVRVTDSRGQTAESSTLIYVLSP